MSREGKYTPVYIVGSNSSYVQTVKDIRESIQERDVTVVTFVGNHLTRVHMSEDIT